MLTLADYVNEDYGVSWDVEAEIQKELEALDANESSNVSGNTQLEMEEEKKGNIINHAANDFENLMGRLQLQNEKLLQFEQSVFSSERCPNGFSKHMVGEAIFLEVNVESAQEANSQNCFLAMQDLIRPLYCFDQEEICQFNDECRVKEKLLCCKKNKVRKGRLEKVPSVGQSSLLTAKSMKQIQYDRMLLNAEDLKSSLLHSLRLNHGLSSPDMVKFEIDEVGAQDSMPFLGVALISNLQREDKFFSNKWAIGTATRASSNSGLFSMDVKHALTKVLDPSCDNVLQQLLHFDCFFKICLHQLNGYPFLELPVCVMNGSRLYCVQSNMVKGKRPFFVSLDPFGRQVIIVCEVTSTSFLKQLEDRPHVSATIKSDPSCVGVSRKRRQPCNLSEH